jgi:hypothetical protein
MAAWPEKVLPRVKKWIQDHTTDTFTIGKKIQLWRARRQRGEILTPKFTSIDE